jgi:cysteine desulfurase / selenocysteine lyase
MLVWQLERDPNPCFQPREGCYRPCRPDGAALWFRRERFIAGQIGLGVAARHAMRVGIDEIKAQGKALATLLRQEHAKRPSVTVHDHGVEQRGIVSFSKDGEAAARTRDRLHALKISAHEARRWRIDLPGGGADAFVRASPHYYNDESDGERFVRAVAG